MSTASRALNDRELFDENSSLAEMIREFALYEFGTIAVINDTKNGNRNC